MTYFVTRTKVSETNHPVPWVFGQVRRLADEFGKPGIVGRRARKIPAFAARVICGSSGARVGRRSNSSSPQTRCMGTERRPGSFAAVNNSTTNERNRPGDFYPSNQGRRSAAYGSRVLPTGRRVPPEVEWFANLSNASTRRAYEKAVRDFTRFTGIARPEEFRTVTRAHHRLARRAGPTRAWRCHDPAPAGVARIAVRISLREERRHPQSGQRRRTAEG